MIGLDISDRSLKIAELTDEEVPRLAAVCWAPVAATIIQRGIVVDIRAAAATLHDALAKCSPSRVGGKRVVVSIPETQSFVRVLEVPRMLDVEMEEAVQWAVREHIPFDLDLVYMDWQPLVTSARSTKHQQVLVGAAKRDVIDPLIEVLDAVKLEVVALELEAQAIVRSLLPREAYDVRGVLLIDLGATTTNVIFFDQGAMRFTTNVLHGGDDLTQQLAQTLHLEPSLAAEKKALIGVTQSVTDTDVTATLRTVTWGLITEIERVVHQMLAQAADSSEVRSILLSGGSASLPGIIDLFSQAFPGIPVHLGNPWTNLSVDEKNETPVLSTTDALHFTTAFGLALRRDDSTRT